MVLYREYDHFHASRFHRLAPLVGMQFLQVKYPRVFLSVSPFHAGERVGTEVHEGDELVLQCRQLIGRGRHVGCLGNDLLLAVACFYQYGAFQGDGFLLCVQG